MTGAPICLQWELPPRLLGAPKHVKLGVPKHALGAPSTQPWELPAESMGAPIGINGSSHELTMGAPSESRWVHPEIVNGSSHAPGKSSGSSHHQRVCSGSSHTKHQLHGSSHAGTGSSQPSFAYDYSHLPISVAMGCCTMFVPSPRMLPRISLHSLVVFFQAS
ncbi:hypothetical protein C8R45DRAFT_935904 [Mycena sanguinolenta]|nr:hypothetical protein C8R45DRAFT_935904 [Mycena sanguinolenta]